MKPNIFNLATTELSQDAFITWLLLWADPSNSKSDTQLHLCAQDFVKSLLSNKVKTIEKVEAGRQWNQVDVWAEVNDKYLIIIEDKTFTGEHSNQLIIYKEMAQNYCTEKNMELLCIYLKTGSESLVSLKKIEAKGFTIYKRSNFLEILNRYNEIENNIFSDFRERLNSIENSQSEYEQKLIKDWHGDCWVGFYQYLEKNRTSCGWQYVSNPAGGFWNFILNWEDWKGFPVYMQIQENKICFKIATHPEDINTTETFVRGEIRNEWSNLILKHVAKMNFPQIKRPDRFGTGNYMTVAEIDREDWLGSGDSIINKAEVLERIKKYEGAFFCLVHELNSDIHSD